MHIISRSFACPVSFLMLHAQCNTTLHLEINIQEVCLCLAEICTNTHRQNILPFSALQICVSLNIARNVSGSTLLAISRQLTSLYKCTNMLHCCKE